MKNILRHAFNAASCFVGSATVVADAGWYMLRTANPTGGWAGGAAPLTNTEIGIASAAFVAGAALFTAGYTRFFGSGATVNMLRKALPEQKPQNP